MSDPSHATAQVCAHLHACSADDIKDLQARYRKVINWCVREEMDPTTYTRSNVRLISPSHQSPYLFPFRISKSSNVPYQNATTATPPRPAPPYASNATPSRAGKVSSSSVRHAQGTAHEARVEHLRVLRWAITRARERCGKLWWIIRGCMHARRATCFVRRHFPSGVRILCSLVAPLRSRGCSTLR